MTRPLKSLRRFVEALVVHTVFDAFFVRSQAEKAGEVADALEEEAEKAQKEGDAAAEDATQAAKDAKKDADLAGQVRFRFLSLSMGCLASDTIFV